MTTKTLKSKERRFSGGRAQKTHKVPKHLGKAMRRIASAQVQRDAPARELYELQMTFTMEGVESYIDAARRDYGIPDDAFIPEFVAIGAYDEQDLIIALKMQQIATPESWTVGIDSHFYNEQTGGVHTIPFYIELPTMSFGELMGGAKLHVTRRGGIRTRWKGLDRELMDHWDAEGVPAGHKIAKSQILIKAAARFVSPSAYREFVYMQEIRDVGPGKLTEFLYKLWVASASGVR